MLGRKMVQKGNEVKSKLSPETLAIMSGAFPPVFGGTQAEKDAWNEKARRFNAAALAELGDEVKPFLKTTY